MFIKLLSIFLFLLGISQAAWNVTCDFDLEGIDHIIQYLPVECQEIYKSGSESELYQASLDESKSFVEFQKKLVEQERKEDSTPSNEIPKQNTTLRFEIYNKTLLHTCVMDIRNRTDLKTESDKSKEYYNCLYLKRDQMVNMIPKEDLLWDIAN